jgi:hypothetical protein
MIATIVKRLQWNGAFGPDGNLYERAAKNISDLCSCLEELTRSADTAELLLTRECPGEAASLRAKVSAAKNLLAVIQCTTCNGFGRIEKLGGLSHPCADCASPPEQPAADSDKETP